MYKINYRIAQKISYFSLFFILWSFSSSIFAAAFQLWEQDIASMGHYHAGYAAEAQDASTGFYNPAGLTHIKNKQLVVGAAGAFPNVKYKGIVSVSTINNFEERLTKASGDVFVLIPNLHYATPINEQLGFGLSVTVPFGSKLHYGKDTFLRYASTLASVSVVNLSPSLGFKIQDDFSIGAGLDIQRMEAEFNAIAALSPPDDPDLDRTDTASANKLHSMGVGYHLGILKNITPQMRIGLSYHSQVKHHQSGNSTFTGPLADIDGSVLSRKSRVTSKITLPPYTALSIYNRIHPQWALMASAIYTQWNTIQDITLKGVSGILNVEPVSNLIVTVPQHFRNTWNISLGTDYFVNENITFKAGVGYDQSPVTNHFRNVQLPDNNRYVLALGIHYQLTKNIGLDLSGMHVFMDDALLHPPLLVMGDQEVDTGTNPARMKSKVSANADVIGLQLTWNI